MQPVNFRGSFASDPLLNSTQTVVLNPFAAPINRPAAEVGVTFGSRQPLAQDTFSLSRPRSASVQGATSGGMARVLTLHFGGAPFKIVSYNLQTLSKRGGHKKNQAKADAAIDSKPDILFLQEAGNAKIFGWWVANYMPPEYQTWAFVDSSSPNGTGIGIIYNDRVSDVVVVPHIHPDTDLHGATRPYPEVHFVADGKTHLTGMSAHLSRNQDVREDEACFLRDRLDDLTQSDPYVFFMGDFNATIGSDTLELLDVPGPHGKSMKPVPDPKKAGREWFNSHANGKRIDHMLVSPELYPYVNHTKTKVIGEFDEAPFKDASDHLPMLLKLNLPEPLGTECSAAVIFADLIRKAAANNYIPGFRSYDVSPHTEAPLLAVSA